MKDPCGEELARSQGHHPSDYSTKYENERVLLASYKTKYDYLNHGYFYE